MQPIQLPDGTLLKPKAETAQQDPLFFSTRMAIMLNKAAEEFAKTYPDIRIGVPAYIYSAEPPAIEHAPSLIPTFCAYDTCSPRFPILDGEHNPFNSGRLWERRFRTYLERNGRSARQLSYFSYHYIAGFCAVADSAAADWRAMVESGGVHGVHLDGFSADRDEDGKRRLYAGMWDYQAMERWVISRLLWDPFLDPQVLRETYIRRAYREAAPEMMQFYSTIRDAWRDPGNRAAVNCHTPSASVFDAFIVKPGNEKALRALLVAAEKKAAHPVSRVLVQRALAAFDRFAASLNRIYVPYIPESTAEWNLEHSTFWLQALKLGAFRRISTWDDFGKTPVKHPTQVSVMRDRDTLYIRCEALDAVEKDRVDLVLEASRHATKYAFAVDREGHRHGMQNQRPWDSDAWQAAVADREGSYVAMFRIPFSLIAELDRTGEEFKVYGKFLRLVSGDPASREESSLTGAGFTMSHYMNYWTALSIRQGKGGK
jgi:hypothetical protein